MFLRVSSLPGNFEIPPFFIVLKQSFPEKQRFHQKEREMHLLWSNLIWKKGGAGQSAPQFTPWLSRKRPAIFFHRGRANWEGEKVSSSAALSMRAHLHHIVRHFFSLKEEGKKRDVSTGSGTCWWWFRPARTGLVCPQIDFYQSRWKKTHRPIYFARKDKGVVKYFNGLLK